MRPYGKGGIRVFPIRALLIGLVAGLLLIAGCVSQPVVQSGPSATPPAKSNADDLLIVDCLLPGCIQRLGTKATYLSARRPIRTTAQDCEIRGGEYTAYDRATYASALKVWLPKAQEGDADAQNKVGEIYEHGRGGAPDFEMAALWYGRAAKQGFSRAQINLGFLYEKGLGVAQDEKRALEWYRKATNLPDAVVIDRGELDQTRARLRQFEQDLENSRAQLNRARSERQQLEREAGRYADVEPGMVQALQRQREELARRRAQIGELEALSRKQGERLLALETEGVSLKEQLALAQRQLARLREDLLFYSSRAKHSAGELERTRAALARSRGRKDARVPAKGVDETKILKLEMQLRDRERELSLQRETVAQLQATLQQWRGMVEALEAKASVSVREASPAPVRADVPLAPPSIQLIEPALATVRGEVRIPVAQGLEKRLIVGRVVAPAGLFALTVNGAGVNADARGLFSSEVRLRGDATRVDVVAVDSAGERAALVFDLVRAGGGPVPMVKQADPLRGLKFGNYHALVIGNRDYRFLPDLDTSRNDAEVVAGLLRDKFGFRTTVLIDATRYQILSELNRLRKELTEEDNLLIYYAGHGELDEKNLRGHWLPVDAESDSTANWISNVALTDILNVMEVLHVLVIADSCYSGTLTRSALANTEAGKSWARRGRWLNTLAQMRSRTALSSGGLEPVLDSGGGAHSVFAKALIKVLRDLDGVAEAQRVYREVAARVAYESHAYQVPQYAPIKFAGHESGDFLFVPKQPF